MFGILTAGAVSKDFLMEFCKTCAARGAQDQVILAGVHPRVEDAAEVARHIEHDFGIRAIAVEKRNRQEPDFVGLRNLLSCFNDITVSIPNLMVLVLDPQFTIDPAVAEQWCRAVSAFRNENPSAQVFVVCFIQKRHGYIQGLAVVKRMLEAQQRGAQSAVGGPIAHVLLVADSAELNDVARKNYKTLLARQLATLLVAKSSSSYSVSFQDQLEQFDVPLLGLALDRVDAPEGWSAAGALPAKLSEENRKNLSLSLVGAMVDLLNMKAQLRSFGDISPAARQHGGSRLAINTFTPVMEDDSRNRLQVDVELALNNCYTVDPAGKVVESDPNHLSPSLLTISCNVVELATTNALAHHLPLVNRVPFLLGGGRDFQTLILYGIEDIPNSLP